MLGLCLPLPGGELGVAWRDHLDTRGHLQSIKGKTMNGAYPVAGSTWGGDTASPFAAAHGSPSHVAVLHPGP